MFPAVKRTQSLARSAFARSGYGDEPDRSPDGWRPGKEQGRRGGRHHPVSPWGQLSKGFKTRRKIAQRFGDHRAPEEQEKDEVNYVQMVF